MHGILALALLVTLAAAPASAGEDAFGRLLDGAVENAAAAMDLEALKSASFEREALGGGVAHYSFRLRVGAGDFEEIRLHRIVRERAPFLPIRSSRAVFLVHGAAWGFAPSFLDLSVFLAGNDVDVWGVDLRWTLVPEDTSDFSFMADWGLGTDVGDVDAGLAVARALRLATGSGLSKLVLLGWSRGGQIAYAQASAETRRPAFFRHVRGIIPVDIHFKTDDETVRQAACASYATIQGQIDAGFFASGFAVVGEIGDLAASAPEDPSPFFPIVSNADFAELIGAEAALSGPFPFLHSVGGIIDPDTLATELLYTSPERWFAFLSGVSPYQPLRIDLEGALLVCDELDSPYDDHLEEVTVPVLFVGAAGGYGEVGLYSTTLVGSSDVTTLMVSQTPDPVEDWGHSDLFLAAGAEALVWQPILDWIESR